MIRDKDDCTELLFVVILAASLNTTRSVNPSIVIFKDLNDLDLQFPCNLFKKDSQYPSYGLRNISTDL